MKKWRGLLPALLLLLTVWTGASALADGECDICGYDPNCVECNPFLLDYYDLDDDNKQYSPGWLHWPSDEVIDYVVDKYPGYAMEDYCNVGSYGFALLRKNAARSLHVFRKQDGKMEFWFKTAGAVPQGRAEAWFDLTEDGKGFSVTRLDDASETYAYGVVYHLKDGAFKLTGYWMDNGPGVNIEDGYLEFCEEEKTATLKGTVQDDLRYVTLSTLPATLQQAKEKITVAPDLPSAQFEPKEIKFAGGKRYAVYTGPGKEYARSGDGKGAVSTNDWIQVFGKYEKWILIQYDISAERYRIGWIEASALPKGADVKELSDLGLGLQQDYVQDVVLACELTDDPFNSRKPIAQLEQGHPLRELVQYEGWSYVCVEVDGKLMCGFVPIDCISHG